MNIGINKGRKMTNEKTFEELTADEMKDLKIEFAPGCFDEFEGSQEELDALVAQIKEMFVNGEAQKLARPIDFDELSEDDLELLTKFAEQEDRASGRTLQ